MPNVGMKKLEISGDKKRQIMAGKHHVIRGIVAVIKNATLRGCVL